MSNASPLTVSPPEIPPANPALVVASAPARFPPPAAAADEFLSEALEELADLDAYAAECDFPPPAPAALRTARELLEKIVRAVPRYYALSPWDNGEVIVYSSGRPGHRVSVCCGAKGEASYLVIHPTRETERGAARSALELPMDALAAALRELDAPPA